MFLFALLAKKYKVFRIIPVIIIASFLIYMALVFVVLKSIDLITVAPSIKQANFKNKKFKNYEYDININYKLLNTFIFDLYFSEMSIKQKHDSTFSRKSHSKSRFVFSEETFYPNTMNKIQRYDVLFKTDEAKNFNATKYFFKNKKYVENDEVEDNMRVILKLSRFYMIFPVVFDMKLGSLK